MWTNVYIIFVITTFLFTASEVGCTTTTIHVTSSGELEHLLCDIGIITTDTHLILHTNVSHTMTGGRFCVLNIINSSLIITSSGVAQMAVVHCAKDKVYPATGFLFTGNGFGSNLIIQRVLFQNCGANLTLINDSRLLNDFVNSTNSPVYFTKQHGAVFVFADIETVWLNRVNVSPYYGFAIICINLPNGSFDSIYISSAPYSSSEHGVSGNGVLLLFRNRTQHELQYPFSTYHINLLNVSLWYNYEVVADNECLPDFYSSSIYKLPRHSISNAAGLTIFNTQCDILSIVKVSNCNFQNNYGILAAGMLVVQLNSLSHSTVIVENGTNFHANNNMLPNCRGSALLAIVFLDQSMSSAISASNYTLFTPLLVSDTVFDTNGEEGVQAAGAALLTTVNVAQIPILFYFSHTIFSFNFAHFEGSCLLVRVSPDREESANNVQVVFESLHVYNNSIRQTGQTLDCYHPVSMFLISGLHQVTINGSVSQPGLFQYNFGSVFKVIRSSVILQGNIMFNANVGNMGGAFILVGGSSLRLVNGLRAEFVHNRAESLGGAIFALSNGNGYVPSDCTFQVDSEYDNISIEFSDNVAVITGDSIYSTSLYNCYINNILKPNSELTTIYDRIFGNLTHEVMSTNPVKIETCHFLSQSACSVDTINNTYPGKTVSIALRATDAIDHPSRAVVSLSAALGTYDGPKPVDWWFDNNQVIQVLDGCTLVNVTIHTKSYSMINKPDNVDHMGFLLFSLANTDKVLKVNVHLLSCPDGFKHDVNVTGACVCSDVITKVSSFSSFCDINSKSFTRTVPSAWIGLTRHDNNISLAVSSQCSQSYCNNNLTLKKVTVNNGTFLLLPTSKGLISTPLCLHNRNGTLCGKCMIGYSVMFGSSECRKCSNLWILTLFVYTVAGPLLVFVLYALNLTLTFGTLNGIIFYAQVANVGIFQALSITSGPLSRALAVFVSVLNLGLGFPLCFFDGMTELWKSGLSLVFPLYLLTIVVFFIILCRYCVKVSNRISSSSIQVLTTVIHLSFSKLLSAIIITFTPAKVYTLESDYTVWYWDGSVTYGSEGHVLLMVVTLFVVSLLLIPYFLLLILPKQLRYCWKLNEWARPILDSIHAPYKEGREFWFVGRLFVLVFMYILYSVEPNAPLIYVTIALLLAFSVVGQAIFNPYTSRLINAIDCWLLLNLTFVFAVLYTDYNNANALIKAAIVLYFVTFLSVLIYHVLMVTGKLRKLKEAITKMQVYVYHRKDPLLQREDKGGIERSYRDPYYSECNEYREPLITPTSSSLRFKI